MDTTQDRLNEVGRRYAEWMAMPFPDGLRGAAVADVCMALLDADVAGCIQSWLTNGGALDGMRWDCLGRRFGDLDRVVPLLSREQDIAYFRACQALAPLVWESDDPIAENE